MRAYNASLRRRLSGAGVRGSRAGKERRERSRVCGEDSLSTRPATEYLCDRRQLRRFWDDSRINEIVSLQVQPANEALAALQPPAETPNEQEGSVAHLLFCARLLALRSQRQRHARTEQ